MIWQANEIQILSRLNQIGSHDVIDIIGSILLDALGYTTARLLVPIVTFGSVRVQALRAETRRHNWFGFSRNPDGSCQLEATMAGWYGLFFWIVVGIAVLALLR
jgi:hypothetical protein